MKIEGIRLRNFKSFHNVEIKGIPAFCVVVGANGTGKSTLLDVFGFLKDSLTGNVQTALNKRGGFKEVHTRTTRGPIEVEIKFRFTAAIGDKTKEPLATYTLMIDETGGKPCITREELSYRRGRYGRPWRFLFFENGQGEAVTNEYADVKDESELTRERHELKGSDILAIKGLAQFRRYAAVGALGQMIENWHVSDFHISSARNVPDAGYAEHLSREGENLALVTQFLYEHHRKTFDKILAAMVKRVPGISRVEVKTTEEGRVLLKFQDGAFQDPFLVRFVSDGTVKMFACLVLLNDPNPHPLLCVEEPENQLYPSLLGERAEEFASYARADRQVFVSTHSPDFLNWIPAFAGMTEGGHDAVDVDNVFWLVKENGFTRVVCARDDKQIVAFMQGGDRMGYLWKEGFFKGASPQ